MSKQTSTTYGEIPSKYWDKGKKFIGKLQVPLAGDQMALIYDQTNTWQMFIPVSWTKELNMEDSPKKYFMMHFDPTTHAIEIDEEVGYQDW